MAPPHCRHVRDCQSGGDWLRLLEISARLPLPSPDLLDIDGALMSAILAIAPRGPSCHRAEYRRSIHSRFRSGHRGASQCSSLTDLQPGIPPPRIGELRVGRCREIRGGRGPGRFPRGPGADGVGRVRDGPGRALGFGRSIGIFGRFGRLLFPRGNHSSTLPPLPASRRPHRKYRTQESDHRSWAGVDAQPTRRRERSES